MSEEYWLHEQLETLDAASVDYEKRTSRDGKGPSWTEVTVFLRDNRAWPDDHNAALRSPEGKYLLVCKNHRRLGTVYECLDEDVRRERFPGNFEEWSEMEHAARGTLFTWEQQQNVWAHKRAGEAMANGELTRGQHERLVADMEPLPALEDVLALASIARARARVHKLPPKPGTNTPPPEERAAPLSAERLAEVQANVDRLRALHPDATSGQILAMLEKLR